MEETDENLAAFIAQTKAALEGRFPNLAGSLETELAFSTFQHLLGHSVIMTLPRDPKYKKVFCTGCQKDVYKEP